MVKELEGRLFSNKEKRKVAKVKRKQSDDMAVEECQELSKAKAQSATIIREGVEA